MKWELRYRKRADGSVIFRRVEAWTPFGAGSKGRRLLLDEGIDHPLRRIWTLTRVRRVR